MSIDTDYATLRSVLAAYRPTGWAIEFGVFSGYSLRLIAEHMPVIGLDSFEGLPENWRPGFPKGKFAVSKGQMLPYFGPNQMLVKGWFSDTIPLLRQWGLPNIGLVHIDCDLYSSTVTALEGVVDYLYGGSIVVFDEFHGYPGHEEHEMKAWSEFCEKHEVDADQITEGPEEAAFVINHFGGR